MTPKQMLQFDQGKILRMCVNNEAKALRTELAENPSVISNTNLISAAIKNNARDALTVLLANQADLLARGGELLNEAAAADLATLKLCNAELQSKYEHKQDVAYARGIGMLASAAEHNRLENVEYLLSEGYGKSNPTHLAKPLLEACKKGAKAIVSVLINHEGVVASDLHFNAAAAQGHFEIMSVLLGNNSKLKIDRETAKVIANKREAAIGTEQYSVWADIDDTFNKKSNRPAF